MDSETSENTDAISADLIANVFSSLSSPVPPNLTNYEFNIFHFYSSLIQGTRQMIPFSIIMNIILIFQSFATNSLLILLDNIERNGENISNTFQFVYFFLNFNVYSSSDGFSPSYFLAIALAAFLCIIIFFFALYLAATKTYLRIRMQCFFVFFIIEVPSILLIVMANVTSRLICHLLAQTYKKYIFQSIILVIFFILLFVMYQFTALTLHNSVYYQMGAKISVPTISFHVLYTLMALIVNIMNTTLPPPRTKIFLSIFYGIIGVYQVFLSTLRFYQYDLLSGFSLGSAFSLFHSCIYYSLRAANYELDPELFLYINFIIFFGVSIISNFVIKLSNKSIVKKLNRDPDFFVTKRLKQTNNESESGESLKSLDTFESVDIDDQENDEIITHNKKPKNSKNTTENNSKSKGKKDSHDDRTLENYQNNRISDYKLALYAKIAFMEALPCAFNLSFLDQAIEYPRPNWLLFQFLRYATLINSQDEKTCQLVSIIESIPNLSISERFIVWEMEYFTNANIIDDPPESLKPAILELETKIIQFQTANKSFTAKISDDATVNSLLIDALSSMKNLITNEMRLMKWMLPNCPQVLQLYSTYKSKVCDTEKSSKNWNTIASELKKNSIIFADFNHVHAYDIFPKMQSSLLQMLTKNRAFNTSIGRQITMNPYAQKLPPITQSRQDSRQTLAAIFSNRLTVYSTISTISFFLLFVILMVHFLLCFTQNSYNKRYYSDFFELSVCFLDTASAYISFLVPAQALIRNGNNSTISDFDYTNIKANEFAVLSSSLSSLFKMKSFTRKSIFKESFAWFPKKIFQLPSINVHYTMNEEITITLSRLTTLYNSIVQDTTINFDAPELPTFIVTSKIFPQFWIQALDLTRNSVITLLDKIKTTINNKMYYSSIPFIIVLVFCCFLPIFILYEMRQLIPLFPHDKSKRTQSILYTFLSRDFTTFERSAAKLYFLFAVHVLLGLCVIFALNSRISKHNDILEIELDSLVGIGYQYVYGGSLLSCLYLNSMENNYSQYVDKKTLFYYMQLAIDYYCNGTITGHIMIPSQDSTYLTHYLMLAIHQSLNNEIRVNETELALMGELFDNYIITNLNNMTISSIEYMEDLTDTFLIDCMSISEVFLWLALVVYLLEIVIYSKMWNNLTILVKMLTQLPEKYISSSEKLLEMLQERTQLTQFSEFKRSSVLDLLNLPCALADEDNYIISTNRLWLAFYNESPDCVIGRDVHDFLKTTEAKYEEKEVNGTQKLIIINEKKREKEYKKRLKTLKEKVLNLRSVIIPRRFLKEKEQTEFDIKFIINCCIIMSPAKTGDENNDRLNPDEWITDAKEYEQWIVERCEICDDVDILRGSCRELMLLFGVNERSSPHLLAVTALTIVIDSMRRGLEYRWRSGGIDICTTISCGFDSKFILKRDSTAMIDMLGDAFSKQMALREKIELNSIICDREIMEILSQCKFGVEFDQIDNDAFIFSFDMAPENSNIRSSSIY